jgi:hypothetical protein
MAAGAAAKGRHPQKNKSRRPAGAARMNIWRPALLRRDGIRKK